MNVFAAILILVAVILFIIESSPRHGGRSLLCPGLACFALGVLIAGIWPAHLINLATY